MSRAFVSLALGAILLSGCAPKEPKSFEKGKLLTINNSLLEKEYNFVPKDPHLANLNFAYEMYLRPQGGWMLPNDLVVKTFLLAHNSSKIVLVGAEPLILAYRDYFLSSGVSAQIILQPIDKLTADLNGQVQALFFNAK